MIGGGGGARDTFADQRLAANKHHGHHHHHYGPHASGAAGGGGAGGKGGGRRHREQNKDVQNILSLKLHLDKLQRERQYKNASLAARNALLIDRDEAARDKYRQTHKTDEELYQEWLDATLKEQAAERLAFERDAEAPVRATIEEEESLERQCVNHDNNLSLFTFTVERMVTHHRRLERIRNEQQARLTSASDAFNRSVKLLLDGHQEAVTIIEREERATRRNILSRFPQCEQDAHRACAARLKREVEDAERERVEAAARHERELDEEVDDMYARFEARMSKLSQKFGADATDDE